MAQIKDHYIFKAILYPGVIAISLLIFFLLRSLGISLLVYTNTSIIFGALCITWLEKIIPYRSKWAPNIDDIKNDVLFMILVQMILPRALGFFVSWTLLKMYQNIFYDFTTIWPHEWSIGIQVMLMVLCADFLRYWLHRLSHENSSLWKLHAIHHSPKKLYWLNVSRFHPVEKALQYVFDALPFIFLSIDEQVLALYFVFYAVNGFFQHCNINVEMGIFNYIISGPQLHRWHHSIHIKESNSNYGNNIIIWDLLFGTYFYPKNKKVEDLGLMNRNYPVSFLDQMTTPLSGSIDKEPLPKQNLIGFLLNFLLHQKMKYVQKKWISPFISKTKSPMNHQTNLLFKILEQNQHTEYGKKYNFSEIRNFADYQAQVPIVEYEDLRPYIEKQENDKEAILLQDNPIMYNQTSGTTGKSKYIPVTDESLIHLKKSQQMAFCFQYFNYKNAFSGDLFGIVSPAIEGKLSSGTPYGSASGHIYRTMPKLAKLKYVLPDEVYEIEDYHQKYYIMTRIALANRNITFLGSANPTTIHKIQDTLSQNYSDLINDIKNGTCKYLDQINPNLQKKIKTSCLNKNSKRYKELEQIGIEDFNIKSVWPYLKMLNTWTHGSCGISLSSLREKMPSKLKNYELGYLSSECRGTFVIDPLKNIEVPNINDVIFEFCERGLWESGNKEMLTLNDPLKTDKEYYVIITTESGLYRYHMNDIVKVTGKFNEVPTFHFLQKGKGVTNITGEKLYESQVIAAMSNFKRKYDIQIKFYKVLADEERSHYIVYLELDQSNKNNVSDLSEELDEIFQETNLEYKAKRLSHRLFPLKLIILKGGAFENYKKEKLRTGIREGQFKVLLLEYAKDNGFDWRKYED